MSSIDCDSSQVAGSEKILTSDALAFVEDLVLASQVDFVRVLRARKERKVADLDIRTPTGLPSDWKAAPLPHDLVDRRVEITGPPTRKMVINALNSGANVYMADFEDSCSPTWDNIVDGQVNLYDAVRRQIDFEQGGKQYKLNDKTATLMVRPRGLHLQERHVRIGGWPVRAALVDFGLFAFHNAKELIAQGKTPAFYLPKMESHLEAQVWDNLLSYAENQLCIPQGSFRVTCLIETLPAAFEMDMIIAALRRHIAGLNCGRWDYIFSCIKKRGDDPSAVYPDRSQLTMDKHFLTSYAELLIQTCHKRGIHAMGGMAAQIPIKGDDAANEVALTKVRADKRREVYMGHDGTWVAHPGLVSIAQEAFKDKGPNQINATRYDTVVTREDLLAVPEGQCTEEGLRQNIRVGVQYIEAWLRGNGCVPLYNLMEDAATAEISRAQVWQWAKHGVEVGGKPLTHDRLRLEIEQATQDLMGGQFTEARRLFTEMSTASELADFLTVSLYPHLP